MIPSWRYLNQTTIFTVSSCQGHANIIRSTPTNLKNEISGLEDLESIRTTADCVLWRTVGSEPRRNIP